jgi:hypothetical protein
MFCGICSRSLGLLKKPVDGVKFAETSLLEESYSALQQLAIGKLGQDDKLNNEPFSEGNGVFRMKKNHFLTKRVSFSTYGDQ